MNPYSSSWRYVPPEKAAPAPNLLDLPGGRMEESVYISPYLSELTDYLDDCLLKLNEGREDEIVGGDPFVPSGLSDEKVDALIAAIDADCAQELGTYTEYHRNRQGCNAPPEYSRLGPSARRAMAEGCLAIIRRHTPEVVSEDETAVEQGTYLDESGE